MEKRFAILGTALATGLALVAIGILSLNATTQQDQAGNNDSSSNLHKQNQEYLDYMTAV